MANLRESFREVLDGRSLGFRHSYWCPTPKGPRYFEMQVRRCGRSMWRRIFVAHEDVTNLKLAEEGLRKLAGELGRSRDAERRRFARELHDTTCQDLVAASLAAEQMKTLLGSDNPEVAVKIRQLRKEMEAEFGWKTVLAGKLLGPVLWWTSRREEKRLAAGHTYEPTPVIERRNWNEGEVRHTPAPAVFPSRRLAPQLIGIEESGGD